MTSLDMTRTLIGKLRAGDATAGEMLETQYREPMIRLCLGYLGNLASAEDATQEIFGKVLESGDVPDSFRAWLYCVARNHCRDCLRRGRRRREEALASDLDLARSMRGPLSRMADSEDRDQAARLISALPEAVREALHLRYVQGLSRPEIAQVLAVSTDQVRGFLFQGVKKLRDDLARREAA